MVWKLAVYWLFSWNCSHTASFFPKNYPNLSLILCRHQCQSHQTSFASHSPSLPFLTYQKYQDPISIMLCVAKALKVLLGILHGKMLNCPFYFRNKTCFFSDWQYLKEATELKRHRRAAEMMSRGEGHPCRIKLHFLKNHQVITSSGEWAGTCLGKTCSHMKDSPHHSAILVHVYSAKQEISLRTAASKKYF